MTHADVPAMHEFREELGDELEAVIIANAVARLEGRWEDVDEERADFLGRMFLPPRPEDRQQT